MIPLVHWIKQNFKKTLLSKRGSAILEGSMTMPIACIIAVMIMQTAVLFYDDFAVQVRTHKKQLDERNYTLQIEMIRNHEKYF